ncbi:hypothetical protein V3C99_015170, partial [Haemonchus contortus]
ISFQEPLPTQTSILVIIRRNLTTLLYEPKEVLQLHHQSLSKIFLVSLILYSLLEFLILLG